MDFLIKSLNKIPSEEPLLLGSDIQASAIRAVLMVNFLLMTSALSKTQEQSVAIMDILSLSDVMIKVLEKGIIDQALPLSDSVTRTLIGAAIDYLVYAELRKVRYLGTVVGSRDLLGRVMKITQPGRWLN